MDTLSQLLNKYQEVAAQANKSPMEYPAGVRSGAEMLIRKAQGELNRIRNEYNDAVKDGAKGRVFVLGDKATYQEALIGGLEALAANGVPGLGFDADELYRKYATDILPSIGRSNQFGLAQLLTLNSMVRATCKVYKLRHENLKGVKDLVVENLEDCITAVRKTVQGTFANNLVVSYINNKIYDTAFNAKVAGPFVLVLMNVNPTEYSDLSAGVISNVKSVVLGKDKKLDKEALNFLKNLKTEENQEVSK